MNSEPCNGFTRVGSCIHTGPHTHPTMLDKFVEMAADDTLGDTPGLEGYCQCGDGLPKTMTSGYLLHIEEGTAHVAHAECGLPVWSDDIVVWNTPAEGFPVRLKWTDLGWSGYETREWEGCEYEIELDTDERAYLAHPLSDEEWDSILDLGEDTDTLYDWFERATAPLHARIRELEDALRRIQQAPTQTTRSDNP